jgi:hypothetical protein
VNRRWIWAAPALLLALVAAAYFVGPVSQSQSYHQFADQRAFFGIPHCFDVISNLGFLIVGIWGVSFIVRSRGARTPTFLSEIERWPYFVFFLGVTLTAFGSSYYHLAPDNARLVWDRLPMAMGFMALLAAVVAERVHPLLAGRTLAPFVSVGIGSVLYWRWTDTIGRDDLRLYALVQFGSLAIVLLFCATLRSRYTRGNDMFVVVGLYALAKGFESLDKRVFALGGIVSGHTLKHLIAAVACFWVLRMLMRRQPTTPIAV